MELYKAYRLYIPGAYSIIIKISGSSLAFPPLLLLGPRADPSFPTPSKSPDRRWRFPGLLQRIVLDL